MNLTKIVYVEWVDACSIDEWTSLEEILRTKPPLIKTIGFLAGETKDALYVALNNDTEGKDLSCAMIIPKKWIKKRKGVPIAKIIGTRKGKR